MQGVGLDIARKAATRSKYDTRELALMEFSFSWDLHHASCCVYWDRDGNGSLDWDKEVSTLWLSAAASASA